MSRLDEALAYARIGWFVFPVSPTGKTPRTSHGFLDATTDEEIIRGHWGRYPDDNIGLALAMSNLCAIDEDPRNGGDEELEAMEIELGPLPRTCVASTAGGGRHFLMRPVEGRQPRGKPNFVGGEKIKGIDFKQNGYILVEGSCKSDGRAYKWLELDVDNIPEVPAAWVEALYHPDTGDAAAPENMAGLESWATSSDPEITTGDAERLLAHLRGLGNRAEGKNTTYRAVAAIFHDWGLSVEEGWEFLVEWNENCGQPHPERELHRQLHRVARVPQLGKRGRARRDIPLSAQIARAAVMVDTRETDSPPDDGVSSADEEDGPAESRAARAALSSEVVDAALAVVPDPPTMAEVEAHLTAISRAWSRSTDQKKIEAGRAVAAALRMKWTPQPGEDEEVAHARLATSLVLAATSRNGRADAPGATDQQLASFMSFRGDAIGAIAAARECPVFSIGPARGANPPDPGGRGPVDVNAWGDSWELDKDGLPKPSRTNVILALHRMLVQFSYDELARKKLVRAGVGEPERVEDHHVDELWDAIEGRYGFQPKYEHLAKWISVRARENSFHPVRDYLAEVQPTHDGAPRVGGGDDPSWLTTYLGVEDTPLARAIGRIVLVAAVRRARQPGCKFDEIMILEGKQGGGKSTAIEILAKQKSWYGTSVPFHKDAREQQEALLGKWLVEAAELANMSRADSRHLKEFCSRSFDEARAAYGRETSRLERQCVFIGTINEGEYLTDPTGARRFWPFVCGDIDLDALRRDVDQLWAEAAALEEAGESIRLSEDLYEAAAAEQEKRRVLDPYELAIEEAGLGDADPEDKDGVTGAGLLGKIKKTDVLQILGLAVTDANLSRVSSAMHRVGWDSGRARFGAEGARAYCYFRGEGGAREVELAAQGKRAVVKAPKK